MATVYTTDFNAYKETHVFSVTADSDTWHQVGCPELGRVVEVIQTDTLSKVSYVIIHTSIDTSKTLAQSNAVYETAISNFISSRTDGFSGHLLSSADGQLVLDRGQILLVNSSNADVNLVLTHLFTQSELARY